MADAKISALTGYTPPIGTDVFPIVDVTNSITKKILVSDLDSYFSGTTKALTNKDVTSGTNTFPTFNQNTTGSAAKLTTARTIAGVSFDGTANISIASTNLSDTASIVLLTSTQTLTNKRTTPRVVTTSQSATPTINSDNGDVFNITALAQAITSMTTNLSGTPTAYQPMRICITDNGTARGITWGSSFESSTVALPSTTVISTLLTIGFFWNTVTSKWTCVAVA